MGRIHTCVWGGIMGAGRVQQQTPASGELLLLGSAGGGARTTPTTRPPPMDIHGPRELQRRVPSHSHRVAPPRVAPCVWIATAFVDQDRAIYSNSQHF